jgi:hypothetical protein
MTLVGARQAEGPGISSCGCTLIGYGLRPRCQCCLRRYLLGEEERAPRPFLVFRVLRLLSDRDNAATILRKLLNVLPGQIQMLHEQFARQVAEPFGKRNLFVSLGAEYLQKL